MSTPPVVLSVLLALLSASRVHAHGDVHHQIEHVTRQLEAAGDNAELYYKRGRLYLEHESWNEALADLELAGRLRPDLLEVDYHRARALFGAGRAADADQVLAAHLRRLGRGDEVRGALLRAHFLHGRVLRGLSRPMDAAKAFEQAVAVATDPLPDQYLQWARALQAAGTNHLADALAVLDRGRQRLGPLVTLDLFAVDLELARGAPAAAVERLDRMIEAAPRPVSYLHRRGLILRDAGCIREARAAFEQALGTLDEFPPHRRRTRAWSDLETRVRDDLASLPSASRSCTLRTAP